MSLIPVDQSKRLMSLLTKYKIEITKKENYHWKQLEHRKIDRDDLQLIILTIGVIADNRVIQPTDRHYRKKKYFYCQSCKKQLLQFVCNSMAMNNNMSTYTVVTESINEHERNCTLKEMKLHTGIKVVQNSEFLIDLIKYSKFFNENKSAVDYKMMINTIGLENTNITNATMRKAITEMKRKFVLEIPNYYAMLVTFLSHYNEVYPTTLSVIQTDHNNCFYRAIISIPNVTNVFNSSCLPMYFVDGAFYKSGLYDGVVITLGCKHGFGGALQLMAAWVPCENTRHYVFLLLAMKAMDMDIENVPFMTDRGHMIAAVRFLFKTTGMVISLKFCLEHLIRNVQHKFNIDKDQVGDLRRCINGMQSAHTYEIFIAKSNLLCQLNTNDCHDILVYLMKIHPRHWTIFGNRRDIPDTRWKEQYDDFLRFNIIKSGAMTQKNVEQVPTSSLYFGNLPVGNKYPLFGICRNNVSESIANSHNMSNVRYTIPPISISLWIQNSIKILLNYKKKVQEAHQKMVPYTTIATRCVESNKDRIKVTCVTGVHLEHETIVTKIDEIIGEHVYNRTVTLFQKDVATCTCCFHHQYLMVCPHIIRAMNHLVIMKEITSNERIKITESFFPDFLKINTIVQRMWRSNFETKIPSDLYEVVDKVQSSSVVLAPPAYKNVSMGGQKRRYMSKGELKMGKYVTYSAKSIKKQRYTTNSAHTKVKYYSSNELNMYSALAKEGYFQLQSSESTINEDEDYRCKEIRNKYKTKIRTQIYECSYCKGNNDDSITHNIRTCKNKSCMGKSNFTSWEAGEYKLLYISGKGTSELRNDYNLFTFTGFSQDDNNVDILNDVVINYQDNWIYQFDVFPNDNNNNEEHKSYTNLNAMDMRNDEHNNDKKSDVSNNVSHSVKTDIIDIQPRYTKGIIHIKWSVSKSSAYPGIVNTCALDTILVILYYIRSISVQVYNIMNIETSTLRHVMKLLDENKHDLARYEMTKKNTNFSHIQKDDNRFNLISMISDWMHMFKTLTSITIKSETTCTSCDNSYKKARNINNISVNLIDHNIEQELSKRESHTMERECGLIDNYIDDNMSSTPVYGIKCNGTTKYTETIQKASEIIVIVGSEHCDTKYLFTDVPKTLKLNNIEWCLGGIILRKDGDTNTVGHFKGVICCENDKYALYDGLKDDIELIQTTNMEKENIIDLQNPGFGIIALFYFKKRYDAKDNAIRNHELDSNHDSINNSIDNLSYNQKQNHMWNKKRECEINKERKTIIENIEVLTQLSNEDSQHEQKSSDKQLDSYELYESKVQKSKTYTLPYKTEETDSSDNSSYSLDHLENRQMEPLYLGDVIHYSDPFGGYNPEKLLEGMVVSIDRKERIIRLSTGDVLSSLHAFKRVYAYNEKDKIMLQQKGIPKWLEHYDLQNIDPTNNRANATEFRTVCENVIDNKKVEIRKSVAEKNSSWNAMLK